MARSIFAGLFCLTLASAPVAQADVCEDLITALPRLKGGSPLKVGATGPTYKSLYDECDRSDTFAGDPLPAHNGRRAKCSTDPNHVKSMDRYPDGTIVFDAKAAVDADGSKFACGAGWPNQCGTWLQFDRGSTRKDVNAEETSFVVVPLAGHGTNFQKDTGVRAGDIAIAVFNGKCTLGVVGDAGPYFRIGELSLRAHADLGHPRCKIADQYPCREIRDSGIAAGVSYVVFPGTRPVPLTSDNVDEDARREGERRLQTFIETFGKQ